jgi:hypothetical protein
LKAEAGRGGRKLGHVWTCYKLDIEGREWVAEAAEPWLSKRERKKLQSPGGDRRELSVCSIHPQSDAHWTKVCRYGSTPPFRE